MVTRWLVLAPELPPGCGGVGDYTAQVAEALARSGDRVTVAAPAAAQPWAAPDGVEVIALPDRFAAASLRLLTRRLDDDGPATRLLVQYVPNVFGWRGANLGLCAWLLKRRRSHDDIRVMFHEPYLYFRWRPDHLAIALAQRAMAAALLNAATHVYFSTDTWRRYLAPYGEAQVAQAITLPIPSAIPRVESPAAIRHARDARIRPGMQLVGHFGSYGGHVAPILRAALAALLGANSSIAALCAGAGSDAFARDLVAATPSLQGRVFGTGVRPAHEVSIALQACDLLLQPYPDGVTTRRTSVMAGLANARPVVTTEGALTEPVWHTSSAVALVPAGNTTALVSTASCLLADEPARSALAVRGCAAYASHFALLHTIAALRAPSAAHV